MNKRNIVLIALALTLVTSLSIFGCAKKTETTTSASTATKQTETSTTEEKAPEGTTTTETTTPEVTSKETVVYGAKGALADTSLTREEMLVYAIQDEYLAQGEYQAVVKTFGNVNPFSNIIESEQTHIDLLKGLFKTYGYTLPDNTAADHIVVPSTLAACYPVGVNAEIDNIAMYEKFLNEDIPEDMREIFTRLRDGSKNHLAAFQNKA